MPAQNPALTAGSTRVPQCRGERVNGACSTVRFTATVRLPYSASAVGLAWWHGAKRRWSILHTIRCRSVLQERGLNAPFTLRQIDEAEFEQRLNAVRQRSLPKPRQLMEDLGSAEDLFTLAEDAGNGDRWKVTTMRDHQTFDPTP